MAQRLSLAKQDALVELQPARIVRGVAAPGERHVYRNMNQKPSKLRRGGINTRPYDQGYLFAGRIFIQCDMPPRWGLESVGDRRAINMPRRWRLGSRVRDASPRIELDRGEDKTDAGTMPNEQ